MIRMRKAKALQFLSHLAQELIIDWLKVAIMHLPQQFFALVVEDCVADGFDASAVLEGLHEEYLKLIERKIRGQKGSEFVFVEAYEVDAIAQVVSSLDDMKIFRWNKILIF